MNFVVLLICLFSVINNASLVERRRGGYRLLATRQGGSTGGGKEDRVEGERGKGGHAQEK